MKEKLYLAYGSNLNWLQMMRRCPSAIPVNRSVIEDYQLEFRRGYLTIEPKKGASVPVGIWRIMEADEWALDRYEGYPRFYKKGYFDVPNSSEPCMVYIMQDGYPIQPPTNEYLTICRIGYKDFGLDLDPLMAAYEKAKWGDDE
jgi:hypothetical protein